MTLDEACRRICGEELRAQIELLKMRNESIGQAYEPKKKACPGWGCDSMKWMAAEAKCGALAFAVSALRQTEECAQAIKAFFDEAQADGEGE